MTESEIKKYVEEHGVEGALVFSEPAYETAFVGLSSTGLAVYDYDKMVQYLIDSGELMDDALDWINYNTIRSLPYYENSPIVLFTTDAIAKMEEDEANAGDPVPIQSV